MGFSWFCGWKAREESPQNKGLCLIPLILHPRRDGGKCSGMHVQLYVSAIVQGEGGLMILKSTIMVPVPMVESCGRMCVHVCLCVCCTLSSATVFKHCVPPLSDTLKLFVHHVVIDVRTFWALVHECLVKLCMLLFS